MTQEFSRRGVLLRAAAMGCSAAASPFVTRMSFASAPWENRLVVIILRGAMDGLDAVRPWGDADFAASRPKLAADRESELDLDGYFGLHPALGDLMPLWRAGEFAVVQAVSTPYRDRRSHFDGQDLLEAGGMGLNDPSADGWLNRMLQGVSGITAQTAYAIGQEHMLLAAGDVPVSRWSPDVDLSLSAQGMRLLDVVMRDDPALAAAMAEAVVLAGADGDAVLAEDEAKMMAAMQGGVMRRGQGHLRIADFAAVQLREATRIASFSIGGWDTHVNQATTLARPLARLAEVILRLKSGLGADVWGKTTVLCMTEFGRTVRENGTRGTDHGTGGAMLLAGGALHGGRVYGAWPGLSEAALYDRRDLMPTSDVRSWAAWVMRSAFGLEAGRLENTIFPGLDMGDDPKILL